MTSTRRQLTHMKIGSDLRFYRFVRFVLLTPLVRSTRLKRAAVADSSLRRLVLRGAVYAVLAALMLGIDTVNATTLKESDFWKLYAHSRIIKETEYVCFVTLIQRESSWNPKARNGSHYGLGQMNNKAYANLDPYRQIDWTIRYIAKRYERNICKALQHSKRHRWF